jgi:hypothetical protein
MVGALSALAVGAAVVSLITGPSPDQIALQAAAQQTAAAGNFSFTCSVEFRLSPQFHLTAGTVRGQGTWQSPDRWRVTTVHAGSSSTTTGSGSTIHLSVSDGPSLTFRLPSDALNSFGDPDDSVFSLPPLGVVDAATDVVRHGDIYQFVVPRLSLVSLGFGWVAYAPLSRTTLQVTPLVALNVHAEVVIKDGDVAMLTFPRGIHTTFHRETEWAVWHISHVGTTTWPG